MIARLLVPAFLTLALAPAAEAACAWVLWQESVPDERWAALGAWSQETDCRAARSVQYAGHEPLRGSPSRKGRR
jgi:hypothetical protein